MSAEPPLLSVRDLRVSFATDRGVARVLDRVNFAIAPGQVVGLVGESGCGKTTLARTILGVLPPNSAVIEGGEVVFDGRDLLAMDAARVASTVRGRAITFIPQDPYSSFNPVFTVGTQMMELMKWKSPLLRRQGDEAGRRVGGGALPAVLRRYPRARYRADRERVMELLRMAQLPRPEEILRKYPHELSGGQRQRLMIAMALLPEPKLIIADEPTTALDVTIQAQILKLLRRLIAASGVAVLFTTHDLGTAYEVCDRVTVMYAGQDVESAPTAAFFTRPSHPYTKRLLDSLPSAERGTLAGIPGEIPGLIDPPGGCRFHPRCERATEECRRVRPLPDRLGADHYVRCYHPFEYGGGSERDRARLTA
ncbi:MAG TPA: ABC transporter ATP-binding protein [Geminicoccaceae bacterium]|nr:ABC transporter ATP-binding protein [Geminicoccaceae bacterium]